MDDLDIIRRLRVSMGGAIAFARRRQAKKTKPVPVTVTVDDMMTILERQNYRCALTGLPFWNDDAAAYGPTLPSIDRIKASAGYTPANVRVVLLGINGLRGAGTDDDLYRIAKALLAYRPRATAFKAAATIRRTKAAT